MEAAQAAVSQPAGEGDSHGDMLESSGGALPAAENHPPEAPVLECSNGEPGVPEAVQNGDTSEVDTGADCSGTPDVAQGGGQACIFLPSKVSVQSQKLIAEHIKTLHHRIQERERRESAAEEDRLLQAAREAEGRVGKLELVFSISMGDVTVSPRSREVSSPRSTQAPPRSTQAPPLLSTTAFDRSAAGLPARRLTEEDIRAVSDEELDDAFIAEGFGGVFDQPDGDSGSDNIDTDYGTLAEAKEQDSPVALSLAPPDHPEQAPIPSMVDFTVPADIQEEIVAEAEEEREREEQRRLKREAKRKRRRKANASPRQDSPDSLVYASDTSSKASTTTREIRSVAQAGHMHPADPGTSCCLLY